MTLNEIIEHIGIEPYYQDDAGVIYNADCLDIMKKMPDKCVDLVLTDPQYGINMAEWDKQPIGIKEISELLRVSIKQIIFGGNYFPLPLTGGWLCWDKTYSDDIRGKKLTTGGVPRENMFDFELIWTSFLKKPKFIRYTYMGNLCGFNNKLDVDYSQQPKIHETQKPLPLIKYILEKYCNNDMYIIDPFAGSLTTCVAAKQLGCKYIGVEISEAYCKIAVQRLAQEILI